MCRVLFCCVLLALGGLAVQARAQSSAVQGLSWSGELQTSWQGQQPNAAGPLARAAALLPGQFSLPAGQAVQRGELSAGWQPASSPYSLAGRFALQASQAEQGGQSSQGRVNELAVSADWGAWQATLGKKIVSWDVGYAWRPNDVVQQETRRQLLPITPEGRPLLMLEHFDADSASAWVLVHPQRLQGGGQRFLGAQEGALAARGYRRLGALDAYVFGRMGQHSGLSLGTAAAWVASDALELHGSARWLQRHDGLVNTAGGSAQLVGQSPWLLQPRGRAGQWLIGGTWTGEQQQSLLFEVWHDGTAPSNADWRHWATRNAGLAAFPTQQPTLRSAVAGNLAWQADALGSQRFSLLSSNLRQDNVYLRASLQPQGAWPGAWTLAADWLVTPADRGQVLGASLQWQGDRLRLDLAWRRYGGPATSLYAQLPMRSSISLAATFSF